MSRVNLSVTVDDAHQDQILAVAAALQAAGLQVEQTMETIGVITGTADASQISNLSRVAGVANVEQGQAVQLPPSDSPLQ
jgi:alkylhydroperoxidase/carboxymuconolactone decarboxylase family protein YurZ